MALTRVDTFAAESAGVHHSFHHAAAMHQNGLYCPIPYLKLYATAIKVIKVKSVSNKLNRPHRGFSLAFTHDNVYIAGLFCLAVGSDAL